MVTQLHGYITIMPYVVTIGKCLSSAYVTLKIIKSYTAEKALLMKDDLTEKVRRLRAIEYKGERL